MTNPIEQEFYEMFDIKPIPCCNHEPYTCNCINELAERLPIITDHRLLELVCLYTSIRNLNRCCDTIEKLKNEILNNLCIIYYYTRNNEEKNALYHDVRKIMGVIKDE